MATNADMSKLLTEPELSFLRDQKIKVSEVFDARMMTKRQRESFAEESGRQFMIGSECEAQGHRLRTKVGHCMQCDTSKIARMKRFSESAFVYIAGSLMTKTIKIGTSKVPDERHRKNGYDGYGGANDWVPLFEAKFENAGRVESDVQSMLDRFRVSSEYLKDGVTKQNSRETFTCSFSEAKRAVMTTKEKQLAKEWISPRASLYEFGRQAVRSVSGGHQ